MCKFDLAYQGDPVAIMQQAKKMIEGDGGAFRATDTRAWFTVPTPLGSVYGECVLAQGSRIDVAITKKPFLVPCAVIKERMAAAFTAASAAAKAAAAPQDDA